MPTLPKTAMIFAAGLGTRMRPLTNTTPKAMVEVCGKPLIDYRIEKLITAGVQKIVINTHYLAPIIEDHVAKRTDVEIVICYEQTILETGGGLVNALPHLGSEPFYITNCDTIWTDEPGDDTALMRLANAWNDKSNVVMLLQPIKKARGYSGDGDFNVNDAGKILWPTTPRDYVYTGVQLCSSRLFLGLKTEPFSLATVWKKHINSSNNKKGISGVIHSGQWLHIDSVANLHDAEDYLQKTHKIDFECH